MQYRVKLEKQRNTFGGMESLDNERDVAASMKILRAR